VVSYRDVGDGEAVFIAFDYYYQDANASLIIGNTFNWLKGLSGVNWLTVDPDSAGITSGDSVITYVTISSENLSDGVYTTWIVISTNDPLHPFDSIPVTLTVQGAPCPAFNYSIQDCNGIVCFTDVGLSAASWQWNFGDGSVGSVPVPAIVAAIVFLASYAVLRWTIFGRSVYAIGGNPDAARLAGIPVERVTVAVYALSGLLVGLAAVMFTGRIQSATPQVGTGLELQVIAAVLLGGVSFTGGRGSIVGALVGALLLAVINNGLDLVAVSSFWQGVVTGVILIFAVWLDRFRRTT
jgi:ABC-type glucose/galactose transport system permease subunit